MEEIYFDEAKRAQQGTSKSFVILSLLLSGAVALAVGFLTFSCVTYSSLSPLQKFYFGEYVKSSLNQSNFMRFGEYQVLSYQAVNPQTKKKEWYSCIEDQLIAETDESGNVLYSEDKFPMFELKPEVPFEKGTLKYYLNKVEHRWMHNFLAQRIYQNDLLSYFYPSAGSASFSFVFAFVGMCAFRKKRLAKILEGKYLRGTRMVSPEEYIVEMKTEADGYGIEVFAVE